MVDFEAFLEKIWGGWGLQGWILGGIKEFCGGPGEIFGGDLGIAGRIWGFWGVGGFFGGFWGDFGRDWGFGGGGVSWRNLMVIWGFLGEFGDVARLFLSFWYTHIFSVLQTPNSWSSCSSVKCGRKEPLSGLVVLCPRNSTQHHNLGHGEEMWCFCSCICAKHLSESSVFVKL